MVQQFVPTLVLSIVGVADAPLASLVHVPSDVIQDVAINATTNNHGVHTNVGIAIDAVVKAIL